MDEWLDGLEEGVSALVETELSSVVFVRDYLQLLFEPVADGETPLATLNLYVWPIIHCHAGVVGKGANGYRDALCSLIDVVVMTARVAADQAVLTFADGTAVQIPLGKEAYTGPELLNLLLDDGRVWIV
jgi:hypothetical protein